MRERTHLPVPLSIPQAADDRGVKQKRRIALADLIRNTKLPGTPADGERPQLYCEPLFPTRLNLAPTKPPDVPNAAGDDEQARHKACQDPAHGRSLQRRAVTADHAQSRWVAGANLTVAQGIVGDARPILPILAPDR